MSVRAFEFDLARQVRPSRPASARSLSTLRLNVILTHGIPPAFRRGVHIHTANRHRAAVPSLLGHAISYRRSSRPGVHRHRGSSPQSRLTRNGWPWAIFFVCLPFPTLTIGMKWACHVRCINYRRRLFIGLGSLEIIISSSQQISNHELICYLICHLIYPGC